MNLIILLLSITWQSLLAQETASLPDKLSETGLYKDIKKGTINPDLIFYVPNFELWSDGSKKRRWIKLPKQTGTDKPIPINVSNIDRWVFPVGTTFWKEFQFKVLPEKEGEKTKWKRIETRVLKKTAANQWIARTYKWNDSTENPDALAVPRRGERDVHSTSATTSHDIPSVSHCNYCHDSGGDFVLGFDPIQLMQTPDAESTSEDSIRLQDLEKQGYLSQALSKRALIHGRTKLERQVMGALHANCGGCHNPDGNAGVDLHLRYKIAGTESYKDTPLFATAVNMPTYTFIPNLSPEQEKKKRLITPGHPELSTVRYRLEATQRSARMPPLGRELHDAKRVKKLKEWIQSLK